MSQPVGLVQNGRRDGERSEIMETGGYLQISKGFRFQTDPFSQGHCNFFNSVHIGTQRGLFRAWKRGEKFYRRGKLFVETMAECSVILGEIVLFNRSLDFNFKKLIFPRFWNEIVDPSFPDCFDQRVHIGVTAEDERDDVRNLFFRLREELEPIHFRHQVIRQDDGGGGLFNKGERLVAAGRKDKLIRFSSKDSLKRVENVNLVIQDKQRVGHRRSYSSIIMAPSSVTLSWVIPG